MKLWFILRLNHWNFFATSAMLVKLTIRMDNTFNCAMFCPIYKTFCPICWTVCPICWIICPIWMSNPLLMRENLAGIKKNMNWNFLVSNQLCFVRAHWVPRVPFSAALARNVQDKRPSLKQLNFSDTKFEYLTVSIEEDNQNLASIGLFTIFH